MIYISHRGNIAGPNPERENTPEYISEALSLGFNVEIDVWFKDDEFYLGHDSPLYDIDENFLKDERLWCHSKNIESLNKMICMNNINCFWHQNDDYTITKNGYIWVYPGKKLTRQSIVVMPEMYIEKWWRYKFENVAGICSDYIKNIRDRIV